MMHQLDVGNVVHIMEKLHSCRYKLLHVETVPILEYGKLALQSNDVQFEWELMGFDFT